MLHRLPIIIAAAIVAQSTPVAAQQAVLTAAVMEVGVTADLNLRLFPSEDAPILAVIPQGTIVPIHRCAVGYQWCEVTYVNNTGWVSASYVIAIARQVPILEIGAELGIVVVELAAVQALNQPPLPAVPGPDQVCFYADFSYQGPGFCITMGLSNGNLEADWNDRISSLRVGSAASVDVCTDVEFGGTCVRYEGDAAELPMAINDAVSSYRTPAEQLAGPIPVMPAPNEVCFYSEFNYQGDGFCVTMGQSNPALAADWIDRISSLRVGATASVEACTDLEFTGVCALFLEDIDQLPPNFNDAIASFRTGGGGPQPEMPAPNEVCFYADFNYQGDEFCVTLGQLNVALSPDWNDRVSSLRLGENATIEVCADVQFGGTCVVYRDDVPELPVTLNDAISSYRTPAPGVATISAPATPAANEVCFYSDVNFAGAFFCVALGEANAALPTEWIDRISSLRLGANAAIEVCTDIGFAGTCEVYREDVAQLPPAINDGISSYRTPL
jgi:uncharacterized protein YraI